MRGKIAASAGAAMLALALGAPALGNEVIIAGRVFTPSTTPSTGWQRCDHWLSARSQDAKDARRLESWALGYATAYTARLDNGQVRKLTLTNDELYARIDVECRGGAVGIGAAVAAILQKQAEP